MTVNYTTNLALGQPVTGTESGTWGDDVNNAVTSYLDIAIAGGLSVTVTTADVTLTLTQGTSVATNIGSTTAQYAILNVSGAMTAARNLILPSSSRQYVINNACTGGFLLTVKGSATTGVTLVNGEKAHVFWNGTDYAKLSNAPGGEGSFSSITDSGNLTFTGTGNRITGDFTNATGANRVTFQTSTLNGQTDVQAIPNGTGTRAGFIAYNNSSIGSATANTQLLQLSTETRLVAGGSSPLPMTFYAGGSEAMRIDTSGNVGIGTTSPTTLLTVSAKTNDVEALRINALGASGGVQGKVELGFGFYDGGVAPSAAIGLEEASVASTGGNLLFKTRPDGSSDSTRPTERMRIDSVGNLLLGRQNSDGYRLNILGTTQILSGHQFTYSGVAAASLTVTSGGAMAFGLDAATGSTERMRIDSSGNVGIGTSSPATKLNIGTGGVLRLNRTDNVQYSEISCAGSGVGTKLVDSNGDGFRFFNTATQVMTIDSSGNVGIGTSSPATKLDVQGTVAGNFFQNLYNDSSNAAAQTLYVAKSFGASGVQFGQQKSTANGIINVIDATALTFGTSNTERMRIDSSGNLLVGQTAVGTQNLNSYSFNVSTGAIAQNHITGTGSGASYTVYAYAGTVIGSVTQSGTTAVLYNVTSDQRLKENIQDADSASALIDALQVRQFDWKTDNTHQRYGFIAQELVTVAPEAVHQPADPDDMMAVDYSKLVPMLVKEIQSLRKRLAALEST